jgi:micrococcal nuclease
MQTRCTILLTIFLTIAATLAQAETITGNVVAVADGDTITVLLEETPIKIRFHGIDTPEKKQDYGTAAKNFTADRCFDQLVTVVVTDTDRYGRKVGLVVLDDGRVLNHELVAAGMAHWYEEYAPNDTTLQTLHAEAKAAKRGLWSRPDAIAPADFRRGQGSGKAVPYNPPSAQDEGGYSKKVTGMAGGRGSVYVTKSGSRFHRKGCRFLKSSSKLIDSANARANYSPCGVCRP